jgi:hypothetical protein
MIREPRRRGGPATFTEKVHEPVRLNESVATHSACVTPIGNVVPEGGVQATDTLPWPFRLSGSVYVTATPTLVRAATATGSGQVTSGTSATGGAGGALGALGVSLHPRQPTSASSVRKILIVPPHWFFSALHAMSLCRRGEWSPYTLKNFHVGCEAGGWAALPVRKRLYESYYPLRF